jgi:hypothetical protein
MWLNVHEGVSVYVVECPGFYNCGVWLMVKLAGDDDRLLRTTTGSQVSGRSISSCPAPVTGHPYAALLQWQVNHLCSSGR